MILIVKEPFGGYWKGEEIIDPAIVAEILESDNKQHVIKSARVVLQ